MGECRAAGTGGKRRASTDDVRRAAAGAGEGTGGGTARGLRRAAKPQSSVARLWFVIINPDNVYGAVITSP